VALVTYSFDTLVAELERDEGLKLRPYRCTAGKLTLGIGRNIEERGISAAEARYLCKNDIAEIETTFDRNISWWRGLSDARQRVLINMCFMGWPRLAGFKKMFAALEVDDFDTAAFEMLNSKWAGQVGDRAKRLAEMMRRG
jgi:lysozyme